MFHISSSRAFSFTFNHTHNMADVSNKSQMLTVAYEYGNWLYGMVIVSTKTVQQHT